MNLELLPNEIFLDLFYYFDGTDLLRAFYGLNSRFNLLLYKQFRSYRFRFDSISKRHFDLICQQHLPFIANRVIALHLSDFRETSEQISLFRSYIPSFCQFTHLRSLILSYLRSYEILLKVLDECQHLSYFTHLKFYSYSLPIFSVDCQLIINKIWSLPKLTHFHFNFDINGRYAFCMPTIISISLECVTLFDHKLQWSQLHRLLECTPRLKHLSIDLDSVNDDHIAYSYPTLIRLKIHFGSSIKLSQMIIFFQSTPNLCHLDIDTGSRLINGHQWEEIIGNHLPQLKTFRLKMVELYYNGANIQRAADNLLDSFRSPFWIDKHQWFVRCITKDRKIHLQTLSSTFHYFTYMVYDSWQSTDPHDNQQDFYNTITSIYDEKFFDQLIPSDIRLPNIEDLDIELPINDQFWSIVPNLDKLKSLTVSSYADTFQSQLQTLLDRASRLHVLVIQQDAPLPLQRSLFTYTNTSVRRLYLDFDNHAFDEEECLNLTGSPLRLQCEVLSIPINNRKSIIHLVNNMLNLRSLHVKCADDEYCQQSLLTDDKDELVQWLKVQLPSTCSIVREAQNDSYVSIWI